MSEEKEVKWVCTRCGRRNKLELEADPVALKVCDMCKIQNWCRLVKGPVVVAETVEEVAEVVVEPEVEEVVPEPEPEPEDPKKAEIEALKAQLAELEK